MSTPNSGKPIKELNDEAAGHEYRAQPGHQTAAPSSSPHADGKGQRPPAARIYRNKEA
jgi:hypothetical protein